MAATLVQVALDILTSLNVQLDTEVKDAMASQDYEWTRPTTHLSSDEFPCYAAPIFNKPTKNDDAPYKAPRELAPPQHSPVTDLNSNLPRDSSSCRPQSTLYLPYKKKKKRRTCGGLSRLELFLVVVCVALLVALSAFLLIWLLWLQGYRIFTDGLPIYAPPDNALDRTAQNHNHVVCTSRECVRIAGFLAENLNDKIDPCSDFYEFACGNYGVNRNLPASKPLRHTISDVQGRLNKQLRSILEAENTPRDKSWDKLAKGYYKKCLNEDELERSGIRAVVDVLQWVGGWPTLEGEKWKGWSTSWERQLARVMNKTGINAVLLELAVTHDPGNSSRSIIELDQPKWGVGSRWPYLLGMTDPMIRNYTHLMVQTAVALGANRKQAEKDMFEAVELEMKLVNFSAEEAIRRDPDRGNNRYKIKELKTYFPNLDLRGYIDEVFKDLTTVSEMDTIIIREVEYFNSIQHILNETDKRVIANYISWRIVQGFSPFLPPSVREPFYQFKANQTGIFNSPPPERWEDCVTLSVIMLDMPVGKMFVEHFFEQEKAMAKMTELTYFLKSEFMKQLQVLDWMDDATRARAINKAEKIEYKNGFPPFIFNDTAMQRQWGMVIRPNEPLLHLTIRLKLERYREELVRLNEPLDRSTWYQSPAQVDAYYAPNNNEMIFPAGIMQFPFLTIGVPNYVTYGMVGAVIGHEVSHAFDDQGGRYDENGNLHEWWDAVTAQKFSDKTRCFAQQYGNVQVKEAGNITLNGNLSLGENIADNGGVKTAFNAYQAWRKNASDDEPALPGFQNFTSEQMFFLAYANNWCSVIRPKHYIQIIMTDVHAPSKYRAIIPLQNRREFADAWKCPEGSMMNPRHKCQVW